MLKNNIIAILDKTFLDANPFFSTLARKTDGHEKWMDFVLNLSHRVHLEEIVLLFLQKFDFYLQVSFM